MAVTPPVHKEWHRQIFKHLELSTDDPATPPTQIMCTFLFKTWVCLYSKGQFLILHRVSTIIVNTIEG